MENKSKVENIINKLQITEPPIDLETVSTFFSIKIIPYSGFPNNISGTIVDQKGNILIGVNSNQAYVRQRFTIAHELGHFLLGHDLKEKIIDDVFDTPSDKEAEANKFASELLMPKKMLENDLKNKKWDIPSLSKRYEVSEQAMTIRLMETHLINDKNLRSPQKI